MTHNSGSNLRGVGGAVVVVWSMGAIPGVAADQVCFTNINGFWQCTQRLPLAARIGISVSAFIVLSLLVSLCFLGFRRRSVRQQEQQEAIAAVYQIEPSQIHGPPTTYITSFDSRSPAGFPLPPSAYVPNTPNPPSSFPETPAGYPHTPGADSADPRSAYNFPTRSVTATSKSHHVHFPPTPETRYQGRFSTNLNNKSPQTAPVNPAFSGGAAYPFPGYSPNPGQGPTQPYTAYSTRFPRQLHTGHSVQKDSGRDRDVKVRDLV